MKMILFFLLSLTLTSCSQYASNASTQVTKSVTTETSIFTYDVSPTSYAQPAASVSGVFFWKEGCIYLLDNGEYRTALFPSLPKGIFKWDEATKTLNLEGHIFKMGDKIVTNGGWLTYVPNSNGDKALEAQGDKKCLTPSLTMIGTSSLK
ncbi:hypothetical protein [Psychrobacter sp. AOP1-A1-60]|jgi:hypothetical protein|uniref:hypothetical protein n=1 Tax=Psychrobacter sp. AOP1-A1-60 TaxID=3457727 RepID=UPI00403563F6